MKAMYRAALMVAAFVFLLPVSARSEIRGGSVEVSPFVGYNWFQDKQNLKDRPVYGGRLGYNFTPHWGIEGTVEFINSSVKDQAIRGPKEGQFAHPADDVDLYFYHVDGVYHFMPESKLNPFIVAGFGGAHYDPRISTLDMFAFNVGVGAKYWITDHVALRADLRDYMVGEITQETYHNIAATVGVTLAFGGWERPAPAQAEKVEPVVVPPPPPPPPPAAPTVSLWADPATIEQGQCSKLVWSTTDASSASIDQGIGSTDPNGSRQVCPGNHDPIYGHRDGRRRHPDGIDDGRRESPASSSSPTREKGAQGDRPPCPSCQFRLRQVGRQERRVLQNFRGDQFRQEVTRL